MLAPRVPGPTSPEAEKCELFLGRGVSALGVSALPHPPLPPARQLGHPYPSPPVYLFVHSFETPMDPTALELSPIPLLSFWVT